MKKQLSLFFCLLIFFYASFAQVNSNTVIVENALNNLSASENTNIYRGSGIPVFSVKEETKGSRYLFADWVSGRLVTTGGEIINHSELLYNYDKISKALLVTADKKIVIEVNKENIQSFTLISDSAEQRFERVNLVNLQTFVQVIVKDTARYSLYKETKTVFLRANYNTDGIFEYGRKYDEYTDNCTYYIIKNNSKDFILLADLKPKLIKDALLAETIKVNNYFMLHKHETINEIFLADLLHWLNQ